MNLEPARLIDAGIVVVYLLASFIIGIFAARVLRGGAARDEEGYYLAGRKVPGWMNGISYAVTAMNSDVAPAYCGFTVVVGLSAAWLYLSRFGLAMMLIAMLFAVRWRQLGISTGPEFFALRFGGRMGRFFRVYSSLFSVVIGMIPWIGAGLLGVHMIFGPIFGIEAKATTLLIVLPILVVYVWISGFAGVLVTDVIQSGIILLANVMLLAAVLWQFGGPAQLAEAVQTALPERASEALSVMPVAGHPIMSPVLVVAWMLVSTIGVGGNVGVEGQRMMSCRTPREAAKVGVWGELALFAMLLLLTLPTMGAIANHPELYTATPAERETVYGIMLSEYLPVGMLGLALAALLASVMSTIDSHLNYGSQTLVNDVVRQFKGDLSERAAVWTGRWLILVILAAAVVVTYTADSLIGIAVVLAGMFGSTLAFGWGQWWWWRVNVWSWCTAMLGGPIVYFSLGWGLTAWPWWQQQVQLGESAAQGMGMLQAVIAMVTTTLLWIVVTLVTRPQDMQTLKSFYIRAKPMGVWGPVRKALQEDDPVGVPPCQRGLIAGGVFASILGSSWIALAVLALSDVVVGRYAAAAVMGAVAVVIALAFKRVFRWHVGRLEA
jgi:solute:Na+ symporter, SSS family